MAHAPLLLLDHSGMSKMLSEGTFKFQTLSFEEAKAIIAMHDENDVVRGFSNIEIESIIYNYLGIEKRAYKHEDAARMVPEQDAIVFRRYITESETQPVIKTEYGNEAKKIQNIYVFCELISRIK